MNSKKTFFPLILLIGCTAQIASDIYAPSLPAIAIDLHGSMAQVQFSMAIYMFGLAISQLFYGPLSEGLGRRIPLIAGLSILLLGNIVSAFAPTMKSLIIGRLIQGCGAGACSALWRSIFRDIFEGEELAKYGAYLSIFVTIIVPATPVLGGYFQEYFNWRASFIFLTLYSLMTITLVIIGLDETNLHRHIEKLKTRFIIQSFQHILSSRIFLGYTFCSFLCYGAFFAWFTAGPILLIHHIGISPIEFGWITLFGGGITTALGGWVNGKLVMRLGTHSMLRIGFTIMLLAGIIMLSCKFIFGMTTFAIVMPMILFYFGVTFIWPSAFAGAFSPFGKMAGYAGALYGLMQMGGAAVIGTIISHLPHQNQMALALVFIFTSIIAWFIFENLVRKATQMLTS